MGYTPYKAQRMHSPMTQVSKSGKKDEDRSKTNDELNAKYYKQYLAKTNASSDSISNVVNIENEKIKKKNAEIRKKNAENK
tara:strand:+ start:1297 stop:1539 length:243 start_codon:yes stop_codon:yes gene_type:complete